MNHDDASTDLFTAALGLQSPWRVEDIRFDPDQSRIDFDVVCGSSRLSCPVCGAKEQPVHDRKKRQWQHLHFFQYKAFIQAPVPRVRCGCGKTTQVPVPWANDRSGFTLLFEALVVSLAKHMPVRQVALMLGVSDYRLWRALDDVVGRAREQQSHEDVSRVGVDEKHIGRHGYISIFHDVDEKCVLFATEGRKQGVFKAFTQDFGAHGGDAKAITACSMDFSKSFQAGSRSQLPQADICFDAFHLVKLANEALEKVRRQEVKSEPALKGKRWGTLKDATKWTEKQSEEMRWLQRSGLKTARAWRMKERLRDILSAARLGGDPTEDLVKWVSWARRSRLKPFKVLGATVRSHMQGILNSYKHGLSNGTAESINSKIQAAMARARGFRNPKNLYTMMYLVAGKLSGLPSHPYTRSATAA